MGIFKKNFLIPILTSWDDIYKDLGGNFGLVFEAIFGNWVCNATTQTFFLHMKGIETKKNIYFAVYNVHTQIRFKLLPPPPALDNFLTHRFCFQHY